MKFKYSARNQGGELQTGFVEAASKDLAVNILQGHGLFILSIEDVASSETSGKSFFGNRIKLNDVVVFTRQFSILLESKIPLNDSLRALYKQTKNPNLKNVVSEISGDIESGLSLSQAMDKKSDVFSEFYISMIRSAEITGRMEEAMIFLADYLEKESVWRSKVKNSMTYPIIVIGLALVIGVVILTMVFPQITPIFKESGVNLPIVTKIFLSTGEILLKWWWAVLVSVGLIVFGIIDYFKSNEGKVVADELLLRAPVFGNLFRRIYVARFAESTSVLIRGGIPVTQALEITGHAIGSLIYKEVLHEIAEGVRAGELLSSLIIKNENLFPSLVGQMVAIGEGSGRLDEILTKISVLYTRESGDILDNLTELIQPVLMIGIGVFVGLLFASILIPIYTLVQGF